jgi:hypothetical protein
MHESLVMSAAREENMVRVSVEGDEVVERGSGSSSDS